MGELLSFAPRNAVTYRTEGALARKREELREEPQMHLVTDIHAPTTEFYEAAFSDELQQINQLRHFYDRSLARANIREVQDPQGKPDNYDLVTARWNFERCKTLKEQNKFLNEELRNIEKSVSERVRVEKSEFSLYIDEEGKMWSMLLNKDPLIDIYSRGFSFKQAEYRRKNLPSPEPERDKEEVEGQKKIQAYFADPTTPLGAIMIDISGKGLAQGTTNNDNFVDMYRLLLEERDKEGNIKKRIISYTRFTSNLEYRAYRKVAQTMDPEYFSGFHTYKGPIDAWFKGHPLILKDALTYKNNQDVFTTIFSKDMATKTSEEFKKCWEKVRPYAKYLLQGITAPEWDPVTCAKRKHAVRAVVEEYETEDPAKNESEDASHLAEKQQSASLWDTHTSQQPSIPFDPRWMAQRVEAYTYKTVATVQVGCGSSGGMTFGGREGIISDVNRFVANSLGRYALPGNNGENEHKSYCQDCPPPPSPFANDGSDNHYHCPKPDCKKFYPDETDKSPETRTLACSCGKELRCEPTSLEEYRKQKIQQKDINKQEKKAA